MESQRKTETDKGREGRVYIGGGSEKKEERRDKREEREEQLEDREYLEDTVSDPCVQLVGKDSLGEQ